MENLNINIATANGTGSMAANQFLTKTLFRSAWSVGSYNFFPSNIAGLPCLYSLRLNSSGRTGFFEKADLLISLNPKNLSNDLKALKAKGLLICDEKQAQTLKQQREDKGFVHFKGLMKALPFTSAVRDIPDLNPRHRILLKNMIYVGLLCEWLKVEELVLEKSLRDFFQKREADSSQIVRQNLEAISKGREMAVKNKFPFDIPRKFLLSETKERMITSPSSNPASIHPNPTHSAPTHSDPSNSTPAHSAPAHSASTHSVPAHSAPSHSVPTHSKKGGSEKEILIDGNSCSALGALSSGCQFLSWYPITPASSLAESFEHLACRFQTDIEGKKKFVVLQAEDELAGISQAIGAAFGGLRAMTVTSGPGLSLMSEAAGLAYFAEIPLVLCNVQRAGPSTGLPTRTLQGDLLSSVFLSHGDSKHVTLLPGTPEEAFRLTALAFDLAEQLSTLVIVLSDLDLGMNLRMSRIFETKESPLKRGKLLKEAELEKMELSGKEFLPYGDEARDGISFRTLPGVRHSKGAYLTRGSGHNKRAEYSERPEDFSFLLEKLNRKWETAKKLVPQPIVESCPGAKTAFVTFGPNEESSKELISLMEEAEGLKVNFMRVRSFPFPPEVEAFLKSQSEVFVIEQNSTGQLKQLLSGEFPKEAHKMKSLLQYDGRPLIAETLKRKLDKMRKNPLL